MRGFTAQTSPSVVFTQPFGNFSGIGHLRFRGPSPLSSCESMTQEAQQNGSSGCLNRRHGGEDILSPIPGPIQSSDFVQVPSTRQRPAWSAVTRRVPHRPFEADPRYLASLKSKMRQCSWAGSDGEIKAGLLRSRDDAHVSQSP